MIEFDREIAILCEEKLSYLTKNLDNTKISFNNIINSDDYLGNNDGKTNMKRIIKLNEDLLGFINKSVLLYDDFNEKSRSSVEKLDANSEFERELANIIPVYDENDNVNEPLDIKSILTAMSSLVVLSRTSKITVIGDTKCIVSVPNFENYNNEKVKIVIYAPGATEANENVMTDFNYMQGLFNNGSSTTEVPYVIITPLAFNVDSYGNGGTSFETGGRDLDNEQYNEYAKFINCAANTTYTNDNGQNILVNPNKVILAGFSQGTRKQLSVVERVISNSPQYNLFKEKLGNVHFDSVIVATSGKYAIDPLYRTIQSGNVIDERLNEFEGRVIYITAEKDSHDLDMSNENGNTYTRYNQMLKNINLIDEELSSEFSETLTDNQIPSNTSGVFASRTSYVGEINGHSGHEAAREAIVVALEVKNKNETSISIIASK